jgi:hypothetical protein
MVMKYVKVYPAIHNEILKKTTRKFSLKGMHPVVLADINLFYLPSKHNTRGFRSHC